MSFEKYFWDCRVQSYCKKVFTNIKFSNRKFVNRCRKVNWDRMEEVSKLDYFDIKVYLSEHHDLLEKLWELEFNESIHS